MKIDIEVQGVGETIAAFDKVERGASDFREGATWLRVQQAFYRIVKSIFAGEGSAGGPWQKLSPKYAEVKNKLYPGKSILRATDGMYKSLTQDSAANAVVDKQPLEMTLGSSDPKSKWHHEGRGHNPERAIFAFTDEQKDEMVEPIRRRLRTLAQNARLSDLSGI